MKANRNTKQSVVVCCVALLIAVGCVLAFDNEPVSATTHTATTIRHDRRPNRERPNAAVAGQGSSNSSQDTSTNSTSQQARPRLVRR